MTLNSLHFKCNWLEKNIESIKLLQLNTKCSEHVDLYNSALDFEDSVKQAFITDILYCFCKHKQWMNTDLFQTVVKDSFSVEFHLSKEVISKFLDNLTPHFVKILNLKNKLYLNNENFLKYIFIQTVTANGDLEFSQEFGLGQTILEKLKNAANEIISHDSSFVFLPEIDATYSKIIQNLSKEYMNSPWIFDAYKLQFDLLDIEEPWSTLIVEKNTSWLLKLLVKADLDKKYSLDNLVEDIRHSFPIFKEEQYKKLSEILVHRLETRNIIYIDHSQKNKRIILLTDRGYEITAEYYYHRVFKRDNHEVNNLDCLNGLWQKQVFVHEGKLQSVKLLELLKEDDFFKPEAIRSSVNILKKYASTDRLLEVLEKKLNLGQTPWVRAAACKALGDLIPEESAKNKLVDIVRMDESSELKKLAAGILIKSNNEINRQSNELR